MAFDDVPMEFDVEAVELRVSVSIKGTRGQELEVRYDHGANSLDEVYDGFKGAMNTLVGFIDSRS